MFHILFFIFALMPFEVVFCNTGKKKDCSWNAVTYRDGQTFEDDCRFSCTCEDGSVHCVPVCSPFFGPPEYRKVVDLGNCCHRGESLTDVEKSKCGTYAQSNVTFQSPWTVKFSARGTGRLAKNCTGTIIGRKVIVTHEDCAKQGDDVTFSRPSGVDWDVKSVRKMPFANQAHLMNLDNGMYFSKTRHEANIPWKKFCTDATCGLYLTSVNKLNDEVEVVAAKKADAQRCGIDANERNVGCMEIEHYPTCPFLDGSGVLIRMNNAFYLIGVLADGNSPKSAASCDTNKQRYRKYIDLCQQLDDAVHTITR